MGSTAQRFAAEVLQAEPSTRPADRLLRTAAKLFASQGIRAVGIDQILREAGVAKASLYSTYGSKDALVLAYLTDLDQVDRNRWLQAATELTDEVGKVLLFFDLAARAASARDFRGCLYANAATEFPGVEFEPVVAHRRWLVETVADLLAEAGAADPEGLAGQIQLLYDGALVGSKISRSTEPITKARAWAAQRIATALT
ncbi:TetR/AcrR family transcriptional regulator [Mycolicibacterium sp. P1-5]|uniref:TetR/AcrR family transcriptional regulator n=1 Tax=Mycolicibacterium sp. P1-5 TaxID=2024617 RepID=UPI0011ED34EE|nr:TetR/AcrR family transcriptional regulator [Mycolicibacterium sp. P1-5]KAA0112033.1 TetR/AcrR family transcriptional regulator [Mycolicibacterium sp. P1-5]